jgi:hypothetical protein
MFPDELRTTRRIACRARFTAATSTVLRGEVMDVSSTGLCLVLDAELERGRQLYLDFDLPGGRVEAVGEVRWVISRHGQYELGIRFVRIATDALAVIAAMGQPARPGTWSFAAAR